jgi:hypothetical protein
MTVHDRQQGWYSAVLTTDGDCYGYRPATNPPASRKAAAHYVFRAAFGRCRFCANRDGVEMVWPHPLKAVTA